MNFIRTHRNYLPIIIACLMMVIGGCKEKGCTDPAAINYNSVAEEDDGSCVICQNTYDTLAVLTKEHIDQAFASPHQNQTVARFYIKQVKVTSSNELCGLDDCYFLVYVESLVPENMTFNYSLSGSGPISIFTSTRFANIPAYGTVRTDSIPSRSTNNPCGNLLGATVNVNVSNGIFYD